MNHPVLVIGGGIGGITAALELAEAGKEVVLVEREPYLGGNVSRFNNYFPKMCPPTCGLEINYRRIRANPRISYYTGTTINSLDGKEGNFEVTLHRAPQLINDRCTACGLCAGVCPVKRSVRAGMNDIERAAYLPGGIPFPMRYTIDEEVCLKEACGKCVDVCDADAIHLDAEPVDMKMKVHALVIATGWHLYDVTKIENYGYSHEPDVITNLELEYMLAASARTQAELARPSDGSTPKRIAFVQCAGSRDQHHLPYCSAVCCSASIKHALTLAERYPGISAEIFYIDLRLTGRNEKLLRKAEQRGTISMTKGKVGRISREGQGDGLVIEVEDVMSGRRRSEAFDLVVLAAGLVPNPLPVDMPAGSDGFYVAGKITGIYPAGSCKRPMDVASTVRDATAAALKSMHR